MTLCATEALALRDCLAAGRGDLARRFFAAAARLIDTPWRITVGSDLQNPGVVGERTLRTRFLNWYLSKFYRAAGADPALARTFVEVANLMRPPAALLAPAMVGRLLTAARRRPAPPAPHTAPDAAERADLRASTGAWR